MKYEKKTGKLFAGWEKYSNFAPDMRKNNRTYWWRWQTLGVYLRLL